MVTNEVRNSGTRSSKEASESGVDDFEGHVNDDWVPEKTVWSETEKVQTNDRSIKRIDAGFAKRNWGNIFYRDCKNWKRYQTP